MAETVEIDLSEINAFGRQLQRLPDAVSQNILERAVLAAGDPIIVDAKSRVRRKSGKLANAIRTRVTYRSRDKVEAVVGPKGVPYAHLIEYGHAIVRNGRIYGSVPAYPFMRPAFDRNLPLAADRMLGVIGPELEAAWPPKPNA